MRLLTPENVSELLCLKVRQVKELARQGRIPGIKVGRLWRFSEDSLKDWIEKGTISNNHSAEVNSIVDQIISGLS